MSDTRDPISAESHDSRAEAELRDAIRSIEATGESSSPRGDDTAADGEAGAAQDDATNEPKRD